MPKTEVHATAKAKVVAKATTKAKVVAKATTKRSHGGGARRTTRCFDDAKTKVKTAKPHRAYKSRHRAYKIRVEDKDQVYDERDAVGFAEEQRLEDEDDAWVMMKLAQKLDGVRTGAEGTVRWKKMAQHITSAADDKQLQAQLKRLQVNNIPGIEEVNMLKEDGNVIHFSAPKVQGSIAANTYVISQLSPDNLDLKRIAESANALATKGAGDDALKIDAGFESVSKG